MKNKIVFFGVAAMLLCAVSLMIFSSFKPQDTAPQYVTLIALTQSPVNEPKVLIIYENNSTEEIELNKKVGSQKVKIENAVKIHETINMLSHKGYKMVSSVAFPEYVSFVFDRRNP